MSIADKLTYLNETKRQLREAINATFGAGLTETTPFRDYANVEGLWSPRLLFLSGEQGAWYDPSDISTLFQDVAGTISVTADGDPVGLMLDKSGNGNHTTQETSAARPIYRTDGVMHWLEFDGVDDILLAPLGDITTPYVISYSLNLLEMTSLVRAFSGGSSVADRILTSIHDNGSISIDSRPSTLNITSTTGLVSANAPHVLTFIRNSAGSSIRLNGQVVATGGGAPDGTLSSSGGGEWGVGAQYYAGSATIFAKFELNGLVVRHGADYTEARVHGIEPYLAKLAGGTL